MHNGAGWKKQGYARDAEGHCWGGGCHCPRPPDHITICPHTHTPSRPRPASGRAALTFGTCHAAVCSVECSVSGQFFASLPYVKLRKGPERFDSGASESAPGSHGGPTATPAAGAAWCLRHLSYMDGGGGDTSLTVTVTNDRMHVSGWEFAEVGSQQDVRVMLCPGGSIQACALRPRPCSNASYRAAAWTLPLH